MWGGPCGPPHIRVRTVPEPPPVSPPARLACPERHPYVSDFMNYLILGITRGSMYALIALGYTLVYGVLQLINFAHSEVFMSGAFGSFLVVNLVVGEAGDTSGVAAALIVLLGLASGALTGAVIAYALERVAYRPLRRRGAPKLAFLISAIGASFLLSQLFGKLFNRLGNNRFPDYFNPDTVLFRVFGAQVTLMQVIIVVSAVMLMFFLDRLVSGTKLGRG